MSASIEVLPYTVLIVEPDKVFRASVKECLSSRCFIQEAASLEDARTLFSLVPIHIVLLNNRLPDGHGTTLCGWIKQQYPDTIKILYGETLTRKQVLSAINDGHVRCCITGARNLPQLQTTVEEALEHYAVAAANSFMIDQLRTVNQLLERKVEQHTRELLVLNEEIHLVLDEMQRMAVIDEQTGLFNRRMLLIRLEEAYKLSKRYGTPLACIIGDIKNFRRWNDIYGHEEGDNLLHEIAARLCKFTRDVDVAARVGSDEFCLVLPQTTRAGAYVLAKRIHREFVMQPYRLHERNFIITLTFGIAELTSSVDSAFDLLQRAEEAELFARTLDQKPSIAVYRDEQDVQTGLLPLDAYHGMN